MGKSFMKSVDLGIGRSSGMGVLVKEVLGAELGRISGNGGIYKCIYKYYTPKDITYIKGNLIFSIAL